MRWQDGRGQVIRTSPGFPPPRKEFSQIHCLLAPPGLLLLSLSSLRTDDYVCLFLHVSRAWCVEGMQQMFLRLI